MVLWEELLRAARDVTEVSRSSLTCFENACYIFKAPLKLFTLLYCFRYFRFAMLLPKIKKIFLGNKETKPLSSENTLHVCVTRETILMCDVLILDLPLDEGLEPNCCKQICSSRNPTT